jgi:hypothetical protein
VNCHFSLLESVTSDWAELPGGSLVYAETPAARVWRHGFLEADGGESRGGASSELESREHLAALVLVSGAVVTDEAEFDA